MKKEYLISAALGNATTIQLLPSEQSRDWYASHGGDLLASYEPLGAEQSGFLIPSASHFEMAGGEFCGNATRAAAVIFSELEQTPEVSYTVSGFDGTIRSSVESLSPTAYIVRSLFPKMLSQIKITKTQLQDSSTIHIVDLGGIVHVLVPGDLPADYRRQHVAIRDHLKLGDRPAVGVIWYQRLGTSIKIDPVVWVRAIDSFFYETSCGSGAIATGVVFGQQSIQQVSGGTINVIVSGNDITLESKMEVLSHDADGARHPHPA